MPRYSVNNDAQPDRRDHRVRRSGCGCPTEEDDPQAETSAGEVQHSGME